ncbi:TIGR00266 family protein [Cellvibrio fontiphilus]|uniref:TIGR00266 family protein n=1 Tax=Cellvibrio fontiphilus TaxID=1815559 RepID=A0ABV7FB67_9GAMM
MENLFKVQLNGELVAGADLATATENFAQLFKITPEKATQMLSRLPVTVKNNVDEATAQKFKTAIEKAGFVCEIKPLAETKVSPLAPVPAQAAPVNPAAVVAPESFKGFQYKIEGRPDYAFLTVQIPANETLKVEASAMATMDTHLEMKTKLKGGFGRFLTGESLFLNEFKATKGAGEIGIAPGTPGDMVHQYLEGQTLFIQNSAFVAATMGVNLETKWQGMLKGFFSGESFFLIRASGQGDLWFNSYGAIIEIDVEDDYVVDTGNIVAFTDGMQYEITKVGGYKSLFFSGEGFVCRFRGQGKVWIQTRNAQAFVSWAHYFRPAGGA